jgi:hypothetical protein
MNFLTSGLSLLRKHTVTLKDVRSCDFLMIAMFKKVNFALKGAQRGAKYSSTLSLTSALDEGGLVKATPRPLYLRERDPAPTV